jgi:hypothetical protein
LIQDSCTDFKLKGSFLHCDYRHHDGSVHHTSIDLDLYIGCVNGRLEWEANSFFKKCTNIALEGHYLTANCIVPAYDGHKEHYVACRLDLSTRLRIKGCVLFFIETDKKLSMILSEVPWMKFKVIAEPDLSLFSSNLVIKNTMAKIAETTVEHVTLQMHKMLTIAMEEAITVVTASAMKHISIQMEQTVLNAVGCATASPSATEAECLHTLKGWGGYGAHGHAHGATYADAAHGHAHGYAHGTAYAGATHGHASGTYGGATATGLAYGGVGSAVYSTKGGAGHSTNGGTEHSHHHHHHSHKGDAVSNGGA